MDSYQFDVIKNRMEIMIEQQKRIIELLETPEETENTEEEFNSENEPKEDSEATTGKYKFNEEETKIVLPKRK